MKKLILVLSIIFIGCETNQNRENANWDFDSSTGDYIQWQSDNDFANEMTNAGMEYLYNFEYDKLLNELVKLESKHPEFYDENSPSNRVGGGSPGFLPDKNLE